MEKAAMDKTLQMASGKTEDAQTGKAGDQPRQMTQDATVPPPAGRRDAGSAAHGRNARDHRPGLDLIAARTAGRHDCGGESRPARAR